MAQIIKTNNGFQIIKMPVQEAIAVLDCFGECNLCGEPIPDGYYIPVINQWYCETCYNAWVSSAIRYRSDIGVERKRFNEICDRLRGLGVLE